MVPVPTPRPRRFVQPRVVRLRLLSLVLVVACDARQVARATTPSAAAADSVHVAADSARADSVALASLPPRLAAEFDVGALLTADALRDTLHVRCEPLGTPAAPELRRRLRAVRPDSTRMVLFARAARTGGALHRVELVRRHADGSQRGFIWTAAGDVVQTIEWPATGGRPEITQLPRGEPTARALRALARRLLALPCAAPRR